jgi:hypothetical protein
MNTNDIVSVITASVAVISLGLSIYNLYIRHKESKPKLDVRLLRDQLPQSKDFKYAFCVEVLNKGEKPVIVSDVSLAFDYRSICKMRAGDEGQVLPFEILPRRSAKYYATMEIVQGSLREGPMDRHGRTKLKACVQDSVGNVYFSSKTLVIYHRDYEIE